MPDKILERIINEANAPDLLEILTQRLSLSNLQSLLLEVYRRRTARLTPADLLQQYEQNRFVKPAQASPQALLDFDRLAYSLLPAAFEIVELSLVCPLGTNSAIATVDQNKVITTIRNNEVCADAPMSWRSNVPGEGGNDPTKAHRQTRRSGCVPASPLFVLRFFRVQQHFRISGC